MVFAGPELAGHVGADIGAEADAAARQAGADSGGAGGLPCARDETGAHVAGDAAEGDRFPAGAIALGHDEGALQRVTHTRQRAVLIRPLILEVLVMDSGNAELDALFGDRLPELRS